MDILNEWHDICDKAGVHPYSVEAENLYDEISKRLQDTAQPEKTKEIRSCATCSLQGDEMYCLKHCIDHSAWERKTVQPEKVEDKTIEIDISQDTWDM